MSEEFELVINPEELLIVDNIDYKSDDQMKTNVSFLDLVIGDIKKKEYSFLELLEVLNYKVAQLRQYEIFENIDVNIKGADTEKKYSKALPIAVDFGLKEKRRYDFSIGLSTSNGSNMINNSVTLKNLFGNAEKLENSLTYNFTDGNLKLNGFFEKPYHYHNPNSAILFSFFNSNERYDSSSYDLKNFGIKTMYYQGENSIYHSLVWRNLTPDMDATEHILNQGGHSIKSSIGCSHKVDTRDSTIYPTRGHMLSLNAELAGIGGTDRFFKSSFKIQKNYPLENDITLNLVGRTGFIIPLVNGENTHICDRFFLGGDNFRGWKLKGAGPRFKRDSYGGDVFYDASAHVHFPLYKNDYVNVQSHFFGQCGNLALWDDEGSLPTFKELVSKVRASVGVGFVVNPGNFRVEVNYVHHLNYDNADEREELQFGFAMEI